MSAGARAATRLTRLLLLLYPPSFRKDVGAPLVGDVDRRAAEHSAAGSRVRSALWHLRLVGSLLANVPGAWVEEALRNGRRAGRRRQRRDRIAGGPPEILREGTGPGSGFSWLDVKLGLRMLRKHPGLTLTGVLGIAVAASGPARRALAVAPAEALGSE